MFNMGRVCMTRGIADSCAEDFSFYEEILSAFARYRKEDWGDCCPSDSKQNDIAVKKGDRRILALYKLRNLSEIFIITEWDRSYTTIMFCNEY